jgi:hypothetical protein
MIASLLFLVIAVAIFFWILAPFFKDYEPISNADPGAELDDFIKTNLSEFSADCEMGKITEEELKELEDSVKKEQ